MANYISITEMIAFTGLSEEDVELFDTYITEAQLEFTIRTGKEYDGTENNYKMVQRAVAFLTAYYIRVHRQELEYAKEILKEYDRLIKMIMRDTTPENQTYWSPVIPVSYTHLTLPTILRV